MSPVRCALRGSDGGVIQTGVMPNCMHARNAESTTASGFSQKSSAWNALASGKSRSRNG